jgi:hypothetical protein
MGALQARHAENLFLFRNPRTVNARILAAAIDFSAAATPAVGKSRLLSGVAVHHGREDQDHPLESGRWLMRIDRTSPAIPPKSSPFR